MHDITDRTEKLTEPERRKYAAYHRVLRSNVRAAQVMNHVVRLRETAGLLRVAVRSGKDAAKLVQVLEKTVEALDSSLAYKGSQPKRWSEDTLDDEKFAAGH